MEVDAEREQRRRERLRKRQQKTGMSTFALEIHVDVGGPGAQVYELDADEKRTWSWVLGKVSRKYAKDAERAGEMHGKYVEGLHFRCADTQIRFLDIHLTLSMFLLGAVMVNPSTSKHLLEGHLAGSRFTRKWKLLLYLRLLLVGDLPNSPVGPIHRTITRA
jgi:hypothetical protein